MHRPSRPGEFHPESLTEPDLILSHHPARAIARRLPPSAESSGSSRILPSWPMLNGDDPPPSLHGHYPTSSLLRGSPPLSGASVLSASRLEPLVPFPFTSPCRLPGRRGCYHPRPPQIRTRRFPASGSSQESFVPSGVAVDDPGRWQQMPGEERVEAGPCEQPSSRSTSQPLLPYSHDLVAIPLQPRPRLSAANSSARSLCLRGHRDPTSQPHASFAFAFSAGGERAPEYLSVLCVSSFSCAVSVCKYAIRSVASASARPSTGMRTPGNFATSATATGSLRARARSGRMMKL